MSKVRIVQLLCPERHCVLALSYFSPDGEVRPEVAETMDLMFHKAIEDGMINPFCKICRSTVLLTEDRPTIFSTMEEASPYLREMERQQVVATEYWEASKG